MADVLQIVTIDGSHDGPTVTDAGVIVAADTDACGCGCVTNACTGVGYAWPSGTQPMSTPYGWPAAIDVIIAGTSYIGTVLDPTAGCVLSNACCTIVRGSATINGTHSVSRISATRDVAIYEGSISTGLTTTLTTSPPGCTSCPCSFTTATLTMTISLVRDGDGCAVGVEVLVGITQHYVCSDVLNEDGSPADQTDEIFSAGVTYSYPTTGPFSAMVLTVDTSGGTGGDCFFYYGSVTTGWS
jgi:hypothetical protein